MTKIVMSLTAEKNLFAFDKPSEKMVGLRLSWKLKKKSLIKKEKP